VKEAKSRPLLDDIGHRIEAMLPADAENSILKHLKPEAAPESTAPDSTTPDNAAPDSTTPDNDGTDDDNGKDSAPAGGGSTNG
jgi:membrane protein required for colicin V production